MLLLYSKMGYIRTLRMHGRSFSTGTWITSSSYRESSHFQADLSADSLVQLSRIMSDTAILRTALGDFIALIVSTQQLNRFFYRLLTVSYNNLKCNVEYCGDSNLLWSLTPRRVVTNTPQKDESERIAWCIEKCDGAVVAEGPGMPSLLE